MNYVYRKCPMVKNNIFNQKSCPPRGNPEVVKTIQNLTEELEATAAVKEQYSST